MNEHPFKIGDRVICIEAAHQLIQQGRYRVVDRESSMRYHYVTVRGDDGIDQEDWLANRFVLDEFLTKVAAAQKS